MGGSVSKRDSEPRINTLGRADSEKRQRTSHSSNLSTLAGAVSGSRLDALPSPAGSAAPAATSSEGVPTVFRWDHGGNQVRHGRVFRVFPLRHAALRAPQVYITGTFNNWSCKVPMHRSGNEFSYICTLPKVKPTMLRRISDVIAAPSRGVPLFLQRKHAFKFIVDDEWRFSPDQPVVTDSAGNVNHFIDLTTFQDDSEIVRSRNGG